MRKTYKILCCLFAAVLAAGILPACNGRSENTIVVWGFAEEGEASVYNEVCEWFNANNTEGLKIDYQQKPQKNYDRLIDQTLVGRNGPDVFYVPDKYLKRWTKFGYLENLQPYVDRSNIDLDAMWTSAVQRYRYNPAKNTNNSDDPLYALPKDISPTVLYYNRSVIERQGVKIISVDEENIAAFNDGAPDRNGKTKADYGIASDFEVQAKGFYRDQAYRHGYSWVPPMYNNGKVVETMIFNNRIAMSWDEIEDLGMLLTKAHNSNLSADDTTWGYITEWWFNYGWGVGGDCAVDGTGEGDWSFTLGDDEKKSLLYNADGSYAYDKSGKNIFVAQSKQADYDLADGQYFGKLLPSQREAFTRFVNLSVTTDKGGLQVAPRPTDIGSGNYISMFVSGKIGMMVQTNVHIMGLRNTVSDFIWDIAPLPVYKEYASDDITVDKEGICIGHSGSSGFGIWTKSKNKDAAYKVVEYLVAGEAQTIQAHSGFLMCNDRTKAQTEYVEHNLAEGQLPRNIEISTRYGDVQRPGDWWYMPDNKWIDVWANVLNTKVRNGEMTINDFFTTYTPQAESIIGGYKTSGTL